MTTPSVEMVAMTPRRLWEREPVRVINSFFTLVAAVNAVLLGAGAYSGATAGIITGIIAALAAFVNEVFTRSEVVPLKPLEDLAVAEAETNATALAAAEAEGEAKATTKPPPTPPPT